MKKLTFYIFVVMLLFNPQLSKAGADDNFYSYAAEFIYRLPNMIQNKTGNLCVFGYDQVSVLLEANHKDSIVFFKKNEDLKNFANSNCKILYISTNLDRDYSAIEVADKYKVISISLDDNFIDNGGLILMQMGRRNFNLITNKNKIKLYDIKFDYVVSGFVVN